MTTEMTARTRWSPVVLVGALALACANVGQIVMTHVNYLSWARIGPGEMDAVHDSWERAVDAIIMPLSIASAAGTVLVALVRHPRVPWWPVLLGIGLQAATFVASFTMWADWQSQIGASGLVRMPDGSLNPVYERLTDTHWLRIALMTAYALVVVGMTVAAVTHRTRPAHTMAAATA